MELAGPDFGALGAGRMDESEFCGSRCYGAKRVYTGLVHGTENSSNADV